MPSASTRLLLALGNTKSTTGDSQQTGPPLMSACQFKEGEV